MRITNMARRNIWEQLWESTEGPTVTLAIPRKLADALLQTLAASLEQDEPEDDGDDETDVDDMDGDLDFDGDDDTDPMGDTDGDMYDLLPAGDEEDEEEDEEEEDDMPQPKRGPGRPPGSKNKKDSNDGDELKDEANDIESDDFDPSNALGESAWSALGEKYIGFKNLAKEVGPGLAADIGRKKYGKQRFQRAAAKGKKLG